MSRLLSLSLLLGGFNVGPEERVQKSCSHLPPPILADLRSLAQEVAAEGQLRRYVVKAMRAWCGEHNVEQTKQTTRCISEVSKATGALDKPAPPVFSYRLDTRKELEEVLGQDIHDAYVRRDLDRVWEAYRRLDAEDEVDQDLREKVRALVLHLYERLPRIDPRVKPPYDRNHRAKWNRENRSKPVKLFDSRYSGADVYRYEKPYRLVAVIETIKSSEEWRDNGATYVILSRKETAGRRIIVKLPKSTNRWDRRIETVAMLAELQVFTGTVPGCDFDTVLVPLSISGEFMKRIGPLKRDIRGNPIGTRSAYRTETAYQEESILGVR